MSHHIEGETAVGNRREHGSLISADKVEGTAVYNASGEKLGSVDSIMIDKVSGEVAYVVMSFGGFLGIGEKYHPLPWDLLDYDTGLDGYRVDLGREQLSEAPSYGRDELDTADYSSGGDIQNYYGSGLSDRELSEDNPERSDLNDGKSRPLGYYSTAAQSRRNAEDNDLGATEDRGDGHGGGRQTGGYGTNTGSSESGTKAGFYSPEQQQARTGNVIPDGDRAGERPYELDREGGSTFGNPKR
ncbi:hypothetical protein GCM10007973_06320 [Polymorphobacter multimanifer]|uniref:Sporulation protein YlmC with PRC-barrel domain n=1 Tax=Polymorphobacter multimanifer TaxID=1070431 RepID=A0A841L8H5_9SPHN|nr:PRC-barrel domain-containing protein [Polymorphobacter multimanifer]MBB6226145.1 sporulation protein YlmC with PRC-barrel domain [Polymorphobacter multimanifer]GGI72068.1 hypothetical protein GCM10007973_06320 [Polymorphobacter multimanifer]